MAIEQLSDEQLYQQLLAGDERGLTELVGRYHSPLLGFLYRQTANRALAEDLVQETFARLLTYSGPPPQRFRPWAFTIAANLLRDHVRSAAYRREEPPAEGGAELAATDLRLGQVDDRSAVLPALQRLPPDQRAVVVLRFYHDMKIEDIADVLHAPVGTVKSRLFHALRRLKQELTPDPEPDLEHCHAESAPSAPRGRTIA
ncbi:MAG: RNA polymerase sigma factor [Chloroflexaceae bacterium]|jgi:RNA polymerase sigma-70 factor (ECF subfamily)|nr:RNA polymerase sigma factor [Chloroflexaceae bacterium]